MFLLHNAQIGDEAGKILNGIEVISPPYHCDSDGGNSGIENVFAVAGGVHPSVVNLLRVGADGNVFRDGVEAGTGFGGALIQRGLTRVLMREIVLTGHDDGVLARGAGENRIPPKGLQVQGHALAVGGVEEGLLIP